jgi:hypothetical protein
MTEYSAFQYNPTASLYNAGSFNSRLGRSSIADARFQRACFKGWLRRLWKILARGSNRLLNLGDYDLRMKGCYYAGVRTVSIGAIRGTQGRAQDFDDQFNPLGERVRERWAGIFLARWQGVVLPLVELIQVGEIYFVRDGHHRISVAKALGAQALEAEVTVIQLDGPLPWERPQSHRDGIINRKAGRCYGACAVSG